MSPDDAKAAAAHGVDAAGASVVGVDAIARVAAADEGALRELYDTFGRRALAIAWEVLRDRAEAEDVVQQTFVEVWRRARDYDPARGSPMAWIATIAKSRALNQVRTRASQQRRIEAAADQVTTTTTESPHAAFERGEDRSRLHALMSHLEPEREQVVRLAYFEGLTHTQIAAQTGQPVGTVKTRLRLGIARLAELLARASGGGA